MHLRGSRASLAVQALLPSWERHEGLLYPLTPPALFHVLAELIPAGIEQAQ